MQNKSLTLCLAAGLLFYTSTALAETQVDFEVIHTIKPAGRIVDTALSSDGKVFFVLTGNHVVEIFDAGVPKGNLQVSQEVKSIESNAKGDILFLTAPEKGTVEIADIQFTENIITDGSPFKGPVNAPVEMAVFIDFQ